MVLSWVINNANGNVELKADTPILDICMYEVEFPHGEFKLSTVNDNAQAMYTLSNLNWNEYLLLNGFVNHRVTYRNILGKQINMLNSCLHKPKATMG